MTAATPTGPLAGIKIFDLTRVLAGPTCVQMLADLGADVIKIEKPGSGDDTRGFAPPLMPGTGESAYFMAANRNKRSVTLDISRPEGQNIARALIARCDILVENFKTGTLAKYGLGYARLRESFPGLVYCSITGFGQTGPYARRPGYDALVQAMGGIMSLTGEPDGPPQKVGVPIADMFAGLYACVGVLAALRHKERTGMGQQVDIGMLDTHAAWLANQGSNFLATGQNPARMGNNHLSIVPYQVFGTADGHIMLTIGNDRAFARFCKSFGLEHMPADPRFATNEARVGNRALVVAAMVPVLRRQTTAWWVERLEAQEIACGPINRLADVFADPQMIARNNVVELDHASGAKVRVIANPVRLSETPADYRRAPPTLGQHTEEVLADWLGLDDAALAALRKDGVV